MPQVDFISTLHKATKRNYLLRVTEADKAECATVAKRFDQNYFDGDRKYGYGGYRYDGRWVPFAKLLATHYNLRLEISSYAVENSMPEVKPFLKVGNATSLPYPDNYFDLVVAVNVLHNLRIYDLEKALKEIQRVGKQHKYMVNDSYRNEQEKVNLLYWQITCECFFTPQEWEWMFQKCGYTGDYDFVFFE
jgi:SAM-dependent methyltransferase